MNKQPELKPCPFCGGKARMYDYLASYSIECMDCQASIEYKTDVKVIYAWNRRVNEQTNSKI